MSVALPADESLTVLEERILAADRSRELSLTPFGRLRISHPQKVSAAIGAIISKQPPDVECTTTCKLEGLILQAEPGLAGGQLSAGYAVLAGGRNQRERFLSQIYMAYGVKAVLLRTWNRSNLSPEGQSLIGIEGSASIINVNFSLGVFRHVGSRDPSRDWIVSGGLGWGF